MRKKPPEIDLEKEAAAQVDTIRAKVGQEVPLSMRYVKGQRAVLIAIDGDNLATLLFPSGARLERVPLRDLIDDSAYWKT